MLSTLIDGNICNLCKVIPRHLMFQGLYYFGKLEFVAERTFFKIIITISNSNSVNPCYNLEFLSQKITLLTSINLRLPLPLVNNCQTFSPLFCWHNLWTTPVVDGFVRKLKFVFSWSVLCFKFCNDKISELRLNWIHNQCGVASTGIIFQEFFDLRTNVEHRIRRISKVTANEIWSQNKF